ncbi:MAG: J domain-containing protein [Alphaproteobacteria bacterium]|nr:J domain-containing protein [Alphaproteobacteria bacterium]
MKVSDAAAVLGLSGTITPEMVNEAWKRAAKIYHPDVNPAGGVMMKVVNAARDALEGFSGDVDPGEAKGYAEALSEALNALLDLPGLSIEICGSWAWITGDTKTHKEALKAAGCRWAPKKEAWYLRPDGWRPSRNRREHSMEEIRNTYGSSKPFAGKRRAALQTAEA